VERLAAEVEAGRYDVPSIEISKAVVDDTVGAEKDA
jgi:hypothetical protein